jgi:hypothetical protein
VKKKQNKTRVKKEGETMDNKKLNKKGEKIIKR